MEGVSAFDQPYNSRCRYSRYGCYRLRLLCPPPPPHGVRPRSDWESAHTGCQRRLVNPPG